MWLHARRLPAISWHRWMLAQRFGSFLPWFSPARCYYWAPLDSSPGTHAIAEYTFLQLRLHYVWFFIRFKADRNQSLRTICGAWWNCIEDCRRVHGYAAVPCDGLCAESRNCKFPASWMVCELPVNFGPGVGIGSVRWWYCWVDMNIYWKERELWRRWSLKAISWIVQAQKSRHSHECK